MTATRTALVRVSLCLMCASLIGCAAAPTAAPASAGATPEATRIEPPVSPADAMATLPPLAVDIRPNVATESIVAKLPPLEPAVDEEVEAAQRTDLWERIRKGYAVPALDNELVRRWEQYYAGRPDYVRRMTERGSRYLFHIVEEVHKRGMPADLALLPFVESAFNPQAMSSARASGMWQFMPGTGRDFELRQNVFRDDRRSVLASTDAALTYLKQLHDRFGDWQHALAAYNWGQGNVSRAIARNQKRGLDTGYETLSMPDETRNYVPKLQAIKNIVARPEAFGVSLPPVENHPYFLTVDIDRDIDVALAARLAGMSLDDFQLLNPQMNKPVILAAGTPQLVLPFDNARHFAREIARFKGPLATWTAWVAPRTLKPAAAARAVGMSEAQLREVNRIPPRMLVKAGSTLLVPRKPGSERDVSEHVAESAVIVLAPEASPGRRKVVRAGPKGESVASIARRYRVAAASVARWNGVSTSASFAPGQRVVLMVAPAASKAAGSVTRVATKSSAKSTRARSTPKARVRIARR